MKTHFSFSFLSFCVQSRPVKDAENRVDDVESRAQRVEGTGTDLKGN